jgi:hypothetical protein
MKKIFYLFIVLLFMGINTFSQDVKPSKKSSRSFYSLVGGINVTTFKTTLSAAGQSINTSSDPKIGFNFGYLNCFQINKTWGAKTGIIASLENGDFMDSKLGLLYLKVPILGQYFISDKFSLAGGLDFDFLILELVDGEAQNDKSISRYFNPSLNVGAEFNPVDRFRIYASYSAGLNNMVASDYRDIGGGATVKMKKAVIQLGISFKLSK